MARLVGIQRIRPAVRNIAERAATCADVAHDHERRGALAEALAEVRTGRFLADRVQLGGAKDVHDARDFRSALRLRSEEEKSELQSIMRISYTDISMKKKKTTNNT